MKLYISVFVRKYTHNRKHIHSQFSNIYIYMKKFANKT